MKVVEARRLLSITKLSIVPQANNLTLIRHVCFLMSFRIISRGWWNILRHKTSLWTRQNIRGWAILGRELVKTENKRFLGKRRNITTAVNERFIKEILRRRPQIVCQGWTFLSERLILVKVTATPFPLHKERKSRVPTGSKTTSSGRYQVVTTPFTPLHQRGENKGYMKGVGKI